MWPVCCPKTLVWNDHNILCDTLQKADLIIIIIISFFVILILINYSAFSLCDGVKIFPATLRTKKKNQNVIMFPGLWFVKNGILRVNCPPKRREIFPSGHCVTSKNTLISSIALTTLSLPITAVYCTLYGTCRGQQFWLSRRCAGTTEAGHMTTNSSYCINKDSITICRQKHILCMKLSLQFMLQIQPDLSSFVRQTALYCGHQCCGVM